MIEGDMGCGKTVTMTAIIADAYLSSNKQLKVFANFHLYGIKYVLADVAKIMEYLNTGLVENAIVAIDEGYLDTESRRSMSLMNILFTWFLQQARKRHIDLYVLTQDQRFIDWRFRKIMRVKIFCERYDELTKMVHLTITDNDRKTERKLSYYAPQYWKYYDTNEIPHIPEPIIERALAKVRGKITVKEKVGVS